MGKTGVGGTTLVGLLLGLWFVITFFKVVVIVLGAYLALVLLVQLWLWLERRADNRRHCAVCLGSSGSILLTELTEQSIARLCPAHAARHRRLWELEQAVRPWES